MTRSKLAVTAFALTLPVFLVGGLAGCANGSSSDLPLTEADAAELEAQKMQEKQKMLQRGQELVREGEAEKARGQALVRQGNTVEGEPMVTRGEAKIAQGRAIIRRANEMDTSVEPIEVQVGGSGGGTTTRPSRR